MLVVKTIFITFYFPVSIIVISFPLHSTQFFHPFFIRWMSWYFFFYFMPFLSLFRLLLAMANKKSRKRSFKCFTFFFLPFQFEGGTSFLFNFQCEKNVRCDAFIRLIKTNTQKALPSFIFHHITILMKCFPSINILSLSFENKKFFFSRQHGS